MNRHLLLIGVVGLLASCTSSYHPLKDTELRIRQTNSRAGVTATFLGNTNLLVSDGRTNLLVDGFFTRPNGIQTLLGLIEPDAELITEELERAKITRLDAILVGHAHHDHALDAPEVSKQMKHALVIGSASYAMIHQGQNGRMDGRHLQVIPPLGGSYQFGKFHVHFTPSEHVNSHSFFQSVVEGDIQKPLKVPAHYSRFNCGQVYAIRIHHETHGDIALTTTAGARKDQWSNQRADVVFLGVGLLSKEDSKARGYYWDETVGTLKPRLVIPVHWDNFTKPLSRGLQPPQPIVDDVGTTFAWVKNRARREQRDIRVLDYGESIRLFNGKLVR